MEIHYDRQQSRDIPRHQEISIIYIPDLSPIIPNEQQVIKIIYCSQFFLIFFMKIVPRIMEY